MKFCFMLILFFFYKKKDHKKVNIIKSKQVLKVELKFKKEKFYFRKKLKRM